MAMRTEGRRTICPPCDAPSVRLSSLFLDAVSHAPPSFLLALPASPHRQDRHAALEDELAKAQAARAAAERTAEQLRVEAIEHEDALRKRDKVWALSTLGRGRGG